MSLASVARRAAAVAAAVLLLGATLVPQDADARAGRGGSFGSRGSKTYSAPPPTATAPGAAPMQRSMTQPGQPGSTAAAPYANRPASRPGGLFGGGLGAGIMGGLLGAGLFGLLSGSGLFGGLGSIWSLLGLAIQIGIIVLVVRLIMNWMRNRRQQSEPAAVGAGAGSSSGYRFDGAGGGNATESRYSYPGGSSYGSGYGAGSSYGGSSHGGGEIELEKEDFDAFERLLSDVQEAWSQQDLSRLRGMATPEMIEIFGEDLAADASRGVVNKVSGVKLLQGDLAEAWREDGRDYATVAMRYELVDVTEERDTGRIVEGDGQPAETTELWTFLRVPGGRWLLTAIQQAE
jgi:predicted lipid-binding transport protein (Tim44 family)